MSECGEGASLSRRGEVAIISFTPARDGTISNKGAAALAEIVEGELANTAVRALILTGAREGIFIRHASLAQIARAAGAVASGAATARDFAGSPFARLGTMLDTATKPVIAAINGDCMGGGFEIALACTMRIAAAAVRAIGLPEIRIGIPPGAGGPQRLGRLIGQHRARLFTLDGTVLDASRAHALGLVDAIAEDALAAAIKRAEALGGRCPVAVAEIMRQMRPADADLIEDNIRGFARCIGKQGAAERLVELASKDVAIERLA